MRILLLGANGQLGSDIIRMNEQNRTPCAITAFKRIDFDIVNHKKMRETLSTQSFDVLLNCASYHNTDQVESHAKTAFDINAFAVKELANICKEKKARFIHISTDYVFSHGDKLLHEMHPPAPLNIYGASKLMGESLAQVNHKDTIIFRVASLFGMAGSRGKGGNFVETIIQNAMANSQLGVITDQVMSPTSAADIARMILKAIKCDIPSGIYHAVNTGQASWYEFAKTIIEECSIKATVKPIFAKEYPSVAIRPSYSALDNQKLSSYVGTIPCWKDALKRYLTEKGHVAI